MCTLFGNSILRIATESTILYIHQYFTTLEMSGGTRSYELGRRLVADGCKVIMLTSDTSRSIGWVRRENVDGMEVIWIPCAYNNKLGKYGKIVAFSIYALISSIYALLLKYDICFATSTPLTVGVPALVARKIRRKKYVFEIRDLWPELPVVLGVLKNQAVIKIIRRFESSIYRNASSIVALSPGMSDGAKAVLATTSSSVPVIIAPNSCDFDHMLSPEKEGYMLQRQSVRKTLGIADDVTLLLYAGTFGLLNDIEYLLNLAAQCESGYKTHFLFVGDGVRAEKLQKLIDSRKQSNVTILGRVSKQQIVNYYAAADIGLSAFIDVPEMEKNSANKFFDTLASGKPVVINYGGWQADFLSETGVGIQLPRDIEMASRQLGDFCVTSREISSSTILKHAQRFSREKVYKSVKSAIDLAFD